jgi:hypothetical protein
VFVPSRCLATAAQALRLSRTAAASCRRIAATMFSAYHPEQYYMRGPGPKCCAKHGPLQGRQSRQTIPQASARQLTVPQRRCMPRR